MEQSASFIIEPMTLFGFLAALVALIFWLSELPGLRRAFEVVPPVIYVYFLPMLTTMLGITPAFSPLYGWMVPYLLLFALFMLMVSIDLGSVIKLGPTALFMVAAGTVGIIAGGPISLLVFKDLLPEDAWTGLAALSGSWIGGSANMVAIGEGVGTSPDQMGTAIVVDTVVGYGWMGILIAMVGLQSWFDRRTKARTEVVEATNTRLAAIQSQRSPISLRDAVVMIGLGMAMAVASELLGRNLPSIGDPTIISPRTWSILIVVTVGIGLSLTPVQRLESKGASQLGYAALYLMLAGIGAQGDVRAVVEAPAYLATGVLWIAIHLGVLLAAARIVRAPLFFVATGSMANLGGAATAPVVAGVYHRAMAPIGLLMAVVGYILGIYGAMGCAALLGWVGG